MTANTTVRAAAADDLEDHRMAALSNITRRNALKALPFAGAAFAVPTVAVAIEADPLLDAIKAYRDGDVTFNAMKEADWPLYGGEDAVIEATWGGPLHVLQDWEQPAMTRKGAVEAVRLVVEHSRSVECDQMVISMLAASLAFFDAEGA